MRWHSCEHSEGLRAGARGASPSSKAPSGEGGLPPHEGAWAGITAHHRHQSIHPSIHQTINWSAACRGGGGGSARPAQRARAAWSGPRAAREGVAAAAFLARERRRRACARVRMWAHAAPATWTSGHWLIPSARPPLGTAAP
eukprot:scaffold3602_cov407-Prasinococcus_capsulatus_cf.AAC.1